MPGKSCVCVFIVAGAAFNLKEKNGGSRFKKCSVELSRPLLYWPCGLEVQSRSAEESGNIIPFSPTKLESMIGTFISNPEKGGGKHLGQSKRIML